jgi:hypothetical protein
MRGFGGKKRDFYNLLPLLQPNIKTLLFSLHWNQNTKKKNCFRSPSSPFEPNALQKLSFPSPPLKSLPLSSSPLHQTKHALNHLTHLGPL